MQSESKKSIAEKLLYVQQNLKAPKGQYNSFGDYHYRSCEDIQEALKPLMAEVKAILLISDEIVQIGDRFYIRATACFQDTESGERITNSALARETDSKPKMDAAQITGSCSSYARKYALNGLFCIDDAKDPDTMDNSNGQQAPKKQNPPPQRQAAAVRNQKQTLATEYQDKIIYEAMRTGTDLKVVCDRYKVNTIADLSAEQYRRAMSAFGKMPSIEPSQGEQMDLFGSMEQYAGDMPFK